MGVLGKIEGIIFLLILCEVIFIGLERVGGRRELISDKFCYMVLI